MFNCIYYILYIYYYILSYTILSYLLFFYLLFSSSLSFPIFCSIPSSNIPLLFHLPSQYSSSLHSQSFLSQSSIPPFPIQKLSIRVGIWISLFIFSSDVPELLTPHKLTEWMVQVCRFEYLGIVLACVRFELVKGYCVWGWRLTYGVILLLLYYIILLLYIYYYILYYTLLFL